MKFPLVLLLAGAVFLPIEEKLPPVFTSKKIKEGPAILKEHIGKRIIVTGKVVSLAVTGYSHRTFWEVDEGLGIASLGDDPKADRPQVSCVFSGNVPESLKKGDACKIEGMYRGLVATSGVPLLVECEVNR